jgi:hypothetical protein
MRAQTVYKNAYIFDLDETLIKSNACSHVCKNGIYLKSLTPKEYNTYIKEDGEIIDFSEFEDGQMIINAPKHKGWSILRKINNKIKNYPTTSEIFILTARHLICKRYIYKLLLNDDINIDINNIITIGDKTGDINIAEEKRKILDKISKHYNKIFFFDDNIDNIKSVSSIPNVIPRLITEHYMNI